MRKYGTHLLVGPMRFGWVIIDTRRCAALSDTASSSIVCIDVVVGCSNRELPPRRVQMFVCNLGIAQSGIDQTEAVALLIPVCPRLKEDMPDTDEGRAFLAIYLLSTRDITSLTALSMMALVPNTSRRMFKSAMPAQYQHVPGDRVSEVHFA